MNKVRLSFQLLFFCFLRLTPLHHLAMRGNLPMITLLLDPQRLNPIWKSTDSGSFGSVDAMDIQVLLLLLLLPIQTHKQNFSQNSTPLHLAATYGHLDIFKALQKKGASMLCLDDKDQNVLHRACQVKHGLPGKTWIARYQIFCGG